MNLVKLKTGGYELSKFEVLGDSVVATYEDYEEFMVRFPNSIAGEINKFPDDAPDNVKQRIGYAKSLVAEQVLYAMQLKEKILTILKENTEVSEVLELLPEFITSCEFSHEKLSYSYSITIEESVTDELEDRILGWYIEEDEQAKKYHRDQFSEWRDQEGQLV